MKHVLHLLDARKWRDRLWCHGTFDCCPLVDKPDCNPPHRAAWLMSRRHLKLCWRHELKLFWAAWRSLFDLTGRLYPRRSTMILAEARECRDCRTAMIRSAQ